MAQNHNKELLSKPQTIINKWQVFQVKTTTNGHHTGNLGPKQVGKLNQPNQNQTNNS